MNTMKRITLLALLSLLLAGPGAWADVTTPEPLGEWPGEMPGEVPSGMSYLGVDIRDVTADRVAALKLKEERGVEITMVDQDAPAGKAGLKVGDVILEFNGQTVDSAEQMRRLIRETPPGRTVRLGISRDGQPLNVQATLADKHKMMAGKFKYKDKARTIVIPPVPEIPAFEFAMQGSRSRIGLEVENLTPQLGEYFGVRNGEGVLVRSVEKGSVAEAAGFRAGDIIIRVEKERIMDRGDWRSALRQYRSGKVSVGIIRDRKEQSLSVDLGEGSKEDSYRFEFPELDLEVETEAIRREIERLKPEMARTAKAAVRVSSEEVRKAMQEARLELEREMKHLRQEMERLNRELERER